MAVSRNYTISLFDLLIDFKPKVAMSAVGYVGPWIRQAIIRLTNR